MTRQSLTKQAMKANGPFANGPRYGGTPMQKGKVSPARKAKLSFATGPKGRGYLTAMRSYGKGRFKNKPRYPKSDWFPGKIEGEQAHPTVKA